MLKIYVTHYMIVDKVHEVISFKESKRLEKFISFNTRKGIIAKMSSKKASITYSIKHSMEKPWKIFIIE